MGPLVELTLDNGHYISVTGDGSEKLIARNEFFRTVPDDSLMTRSLRLLFTPRPESNKK